MKFIDGVTMKDDVISLTDVLSGGCGSHFLQYLSLKQCLQFTSVSALCFRSTLPELQRRRYEQFLCQYESLETNRTRDKTKERRRVRLARNSESQLGENTSGGRSVYCHSIEFLENGDECWCLMPSVQERLEGLCRVVPSSHPSKDRLRELIADMQKNEVLTVIGDQTTADLLGTLRSFTAAHKLHAALLSLCTTNINPDQFLQSIYITATNNVGNAGGDGPSFTVTLDQYVGDVLLATYLMFHSYGLSNIVEGGPSLNTWIASLRPPNSGDTARTCYGRYVYIHSVCLRVMPKTIESIYSYGMAPPLAGMVDQSDYGYDSPVMVPFHCFAEDLEACESLNFKAALLGLERFCLECTFSDFGPLGPAFRGRDRVTTTQISRNDLWFLLSIDSVLPANPILDKSHLGQRLLQFHVECRRNRPVTVLPPIVTIRQVEVDV